MALQDLVRLILPKEDHFYDLLEQQAKLAHEGAQALKKLADGDTIASVRSEVHATEKRGDKVAHEVEDALAKTFVTPIDREDIHKLLVARSTTSSTSSTLPARAFVLFGVPKPTPPMRALMALLVRS
jgi:uncharacterized protein Yka (UPF0111/DUF47 family)